MRHRHLHPLILLALAGGACSADGPTATADTAATDTVDADVDAADPDTEDSVTTDDARADATDASDADVGPEACAPALPAGVTLEGEGRFRKVLGLPTLDGLLARGVTVFLPAAFDPSGAVRYPVLYMHDGQNLFDPHATAFGEWGVDETLDDLTARGAVPATIVVAIDNTAERTSDYTPTFDAGAHEGGNADLYGRWLVTVLKPAIDALLPTRCEREHTAVAGSSLGGLVSTYLALRWPGIFGRVAAVSPSYWWDDGRVLRELERDAAPMPLRFWIDMGSGEGDTSRHDLDPAVAEARRAFYAALGHGLALGRDVAYLEALGAPHNESAWRARLGSILGFLLSDQGFDGLPGELSVALLPSGEGLYLEGRPQLLVVAEARRGAGPRPFRMTLPRVDLRATGPVVFDSDGILTAVDIGEADVTATFGELAAEAVLPIYPPGLAPVVFDVQIPESTPADAVVHLTGDLTELGQWDPAAIPLQPPHGGHAVSREIALPVATAFHYRYTLGTAATAETLADGTPAPERAGAPLTTTGTTIRDLVKAWGVAAP